MKEKDPSWRLWVLMSRLKQIVFLSHSHFSYENLWNMFFTCAVPHSWYSILTGEKAAKTSVIGQVGPSRLRLLRNNMALQHLVKKLGCLKKGFPNPKCLLSVGKASWNVQGSSSCTISSPEQQHETGSLGICFVDSFRLLGSSVTDLVSTVLEGTERKDLLQALKSML